MPDVTEHKPGLFCWTDLATSDPAGATKFYQSLFGWGSHDVPIGEGEMYSMQQLRGRDVAAIYRLTVDQKKQGVPPHWFCYFAVRDVDRSASDAGSIGGQIIAPPFDVFDSGRMAVIQDPTGGMFGLWQAGKHIGTQISMEPHVPCWTELLTNDTEKAGRFYTGLFGWGMKESPEYTEFLHEGNSHAGMMRIREEWGGMPPTWSLYFLVDDCDAIVASAKRLKGDIMVPPTDVENVGRFSMLQDPQGAVFSVIRLG